MWLTTVNRIGESHGWDSGGLLDKTSVQLTVEPPAGERNLWHWPRLAKRIGILDADYEGLDRTGNSESDCWYVYVGHIPWSWVCRALLTPAAMSDQLGDEVDIDDAELYEWPLSDPE